MRKISQNDQDGMEYKLAPLESNFVSSFRVYQFDPYPVDLLQ